MSNNDHPKDLEEMLEYYSEKFEEFHHSFNPHFSKLSLQLKDHAEMLKIRIEKYSSFSRDHQLEHLILSDQAKIEIEEVSNELKSLHSKFQELEKMHRFGQNLL